MAKISSLSKYQIANIVFLYTTRQKTIPQLAKDFKRSETTIRNVIKSEGLPLPTQVTQEEALILLKLINSYHLNYTDTLKALAEYVNKNNKVVTQIQTTQNKLQQSDTNHDNSKQLL